MNLTGDECPNPKPHPDLYLAVEDSPRGLTAARAAGVACLVVPTELTHDLNSAVALSVEPDVSAVLNHLPGRL